MIGARQSYAIEISRRERWGTNAGTGNYAKRISMDLEAAQQAGKTEVGQSYKGRTRAMP
jgi:hypothetical protein